VLSPELAERLAGFISLDRLESMPVEVAREVNSREAPLMFGAVDPVGSVEDRVIEGSIPVRIYRPEPAAHGTLVYFHGGGWVVGDLESHDGVARFLCRHAVCTVVAVDYRLAPEHPFPAALEDAWAATRWAWREMDAPLAIAGDSAGGNLAAAVALRARDVGLGLALQLLVYPALDLRGDLHWFRKYLGGHAAKDPEASPLFAAYFDGVAQAAILSCELDPLREQAERYVVRLREAGVAVRHRVYPGLIHTAYRMPGVLPGARRMLEDSAAAVARAFSSQ
jgi:acetyl esterase